ncbi:hypothetical protein ACIBHX_43825 [Nonomuraea sp. NPDC050536]|uniref:hypothetical protein n=1 Tax=Nonomuraea sp. NPDC050536 TaxID=3364366 RepID=UPI0037C8CF36
MARTQGGPPLGILAVMFTALFVAGIGISTAMAGGVTFPSPFAEQAQILAYFADHRDAVQVSAFLQFAAAVPMAIYAATVSVRLRDLGIRAPGATIALAGGLLASGLLALCAMFGWALSREQAPAVVPVLQDLSFATGGTGHVVFLGLLVAGIAVPGWLAVLLPRAFALAGLVIAAIAELSTLTLLVSDAAFLLPVARFTGLAWLIAAGFMLPRTRKRMEIK